MGGDTDETYGTYGTYECPSGPISRMSLIGPIHVSWRRGDLPGALQVRQCTSAKRKQGVANAEENE